MTHALTEAEDVPEAKYAYACFDEHGKRRTGWYGRAQEAQLFCQRNWRVRKQLRDVVAKEWEDG